MTDRVPDEFDAELDGFPFPDVGNAKPVGDALERAATNFITQVRRGEMPTTDGLAAEHPELAAELEALLPIAQALEQWKIQMEAECLRQNRPTEFNIQQLGDCEIVREIGRGGMGVVFEARQGPWKRRVAVKMLPWRFGDALPHWKDRFHAEAKTIAQLRHPNIVPVYTFGEHAGYCYYVMQLVEGLSLDRVLANLRDSSLRGSLTGGAHTLGKRLEADHWPSVARIGVEVAMALEHAHELGLLHNDIKPANLLVDATGHVLVTDFSTHRMQDELQNQTERATGTYRYMAPERFLGSGDARGDVYSLGVTLYELLTRQPAFLGRDRGEMLDRIARSEFVPPRQVRPNIPWEMEAIVLKAMSRDPQDRYQSAREMRRDLMRFGQGQPISLRPPRLFRRFSDWCRRRLLASNR
jgi:eukaryotic-like serine/threonine-protein kinase